MLILETKIWQAKNEKEKNKTAWKITTAKEKISWII